MSQTISQILGEYDGFEKAFWASYSVNFSTLDFLIKKDFKQIMNPHYLHLICDGHQLDESIAKLYDDIKDMSKLSRLQEYCTISPQFTAGAFHPKILLFTAETKLLFIVSSANATPSGILSNQDLIGSFYYDENHPESKNEVCALFQYLRSFEGWGIEAREDFKIVEESFEFLRDDLVTDMILTIPNDENLFSQILKGLPDDEIQQINIFSPFFDDNYAAISQIEDQFKVPVNIFSPQKEFFTVRKDSLPSNIKFYQSGTEINKSFHAKFYEFNYGDESVVFWGSANCSYSGLLNPDRNYEFLIKCLMNKDEIHSLWGSLSNKKESAVEYDCQPEQDADSKKQLSVYVEGISIESDGFVIRLDKPLLEQASLKGITSDGSIVDFTILSAKGEIVHATCEEKGLVILYVEKDEQRISNLIYINNPFALKSRVSGGQNCPEFDPKDIKSAKAVNFAFGCFNLKLPKQKSSGSNSALLRKGFWRLPQFKSRSYLSRIINLESFIKQRVVNYKEKNDTENFKNEGKDSGVKSKQPSRNIVNVMTRETTKLLKNISFLVKKKKTGDIEITRWFQGVDLLNYYILNYLDETQNLPIDLEEINHLLLNVSRVSAWIIFNFIDSSEDHQERIELIRTIQDILLGVAVYRLFLSQRFSTSIRPTEKDIKLLVMIKRAIHLHHIINQKIPEFRLESEHSRLTYEDVLGKLSNVKIRGEVIRTLNRKTALKVEGLDDVQVFVSQVDSLLLIRKAGTYLELETIIGEEKQFTLSAPLTKENIVF